MFETLMKSGSYRVDYFKDQAAGTPQALGFYACGDYSIPGALQPIGQAQPAGRVDHHSASLWHLQPGGNLPGRPCVRSRLIRPAYEQMKRDLRSGLFKRAFVFSTCRLQNGQDMLEDLCKLYGEIDGFELITFENGACKTLLPCDAPVINMDSPVLA